MQACGTGSLVHGNRAIKQDFLGSLDAVFQVAGCRHWEASELTIAIETSWWDKWSQEQVQGKSGARKSAQYARM